MRAARRAAVIVVTGAALVAAGLAGPASKADIGPASVASVLSGPSAASLAAERVLRAAVDAPLTIVRDARGLAHLVGTAPGNPLPLPAGLTAVPAGPEAAARVHLAAVGPLFGLVDPAEELRRIPEPAGIGRGPGDDRILRFQQLRGGLPVLGGDLAVVLDAAGALKSVAGETLPSVLAPEPAAPVSAEQARRTAEALVARDHPASRRPAIRVSEPERWYLDPGLIGVPAVQRMASGPVWRMEVTDFGAIRDLVLVDSRTGKVPLRLNMITNAVQQVVCDNGNRPDPDPYGSDCRKPYARAVTTTPSGDPEVDVAFDNTERTVLYFKNKLNIDLVAMLGNDVQDRYGKKLRSTVRFCPETTLCSSTGGLIFANAFWNGRGMYYGANWAGSDDIVAHELTHGVTEKTARLLYLYQSGAINEAMSDIFGELVDLDDNYDGNGIQSPWTVGEDTPLTTLPLRNMANPTLTLPDPQPDRMTSPLYVVDLLFQDSGGVHDNSGVGNKAAYLLAAGSGQEPGGAFNNQTIPLIGRDKTAKLFFRALGMLSSGADYADLGAVLNQACSDLMGETGSTFRASTCDSVRKAVLATEMTAQPTGLAAGAAAPEVGFCPTGTGTRRGILSDGFESFSSRRWSLGGFWALIADYARTGVNSLYGVEPDYTTSSSATLKPLQRIPRGVKTQLRFAHQYRLDAGPEITGPFYDGARLEYRVGGRGSWAPVLGKGFYWENGPSRTITPDSGSSYKAFGGDSKGYVSSRVGITSLAGKSIQLRWRLISDRQVAVDGWTIDDVQLFACGGAKPSDVNTIKAVSVNKRWATVKWTPPVWGGNGGVTAYQVKRTGKPAFKMSKSKRSKSFSRLKSGKTYTFAVWPISKAGIGPGRTFKVKVK